MTASCLYPKEESLEKKYCPEIIDSHFSFESLIKNNTAWITENQSYLNTLYENYIHLNKKRIKKKNILIITGNQDVEIADLYFLNSFFSHVFYFPIFLDLSELQEVIILENASDYVIGMHVNMQHKIINLFRGDFSSLIISFDFFKKSDDNLSPDFTDSSIEDFGQTIKFGNYEASVDAILYEFDKKYRKKLQKKYSEQDNSFGACFRRLRIQRRLRQIDFEGIDQKEIRRIENGEVTKLHSKTKEIIQKVLNIEFNEIQEY